MLGFIFILAGFILVFLPKSQWYKDYIEKHNYEDREDFRKFVRSVFAVCFFLSGGFMLL